MDIAATSAYWHTDKIQLHDPLFWTAIAPGDLDGDGTTDVFVLGNHSYDLFLNPFDL